MRTFISVANLQLNSSAGTIFSRVAHAKNALIPPALAFTLNGSTVSQWNDKSGNGRNASQGTAANQPAYVTNVYNGKPTVRSDGLNDFLSFTPFSVSAGIRAYGVINPRNPSAAHRNGDWLWMTNLTTLSRRARK